MKTPDAKTIQLLEKVRKGATASLSAAQFAQVLETVGFKVVKYRQFDAHAEARNYAYLITTPNGTAEFNLRKQPGYRIVVLHEALPWAQAHGLVRRVCDLLGKPTIEEERAQKAANKRTTERRFTCGCCFGEFKTNENPRADDFGRLVRHGYRRPGYGYLEGGCHGEFSVPFEVSKVTSEKFLAEVVRPHLERLETELTRLEAQPDKVILARRSKVETYAKGDSRYVGALAQQISKIKGELYYVRKDVELFEEKIASWKPTWRHLKTGEVNRNAAAALAYTPAE